jgi:hypothetical protein
MTPTALNTYLNNLVKNSLQISTMIWGAPGIGKSSIVAQVAKEHKIDFVDVRLSQLAPTDLRGLPVAEDGISKWYPPEFLPHSGRGILFLDELNMAPPAMQGMAQQLILDRRVGSYVVPEGWYVWAAGNRKEDRAAVLICRLPSPIAFYTYKSSQILIVSKPMPWRIECTSKSSPFYLFALTCSIS